MLLRSVSVSVIALALVGATVAPAIATAPNDNHQTIDNDYWWPNRLDLSPLRRNAHLGDPAKGAFDYKAAFNSLDLEALKKDLRELMTTSQDWWPADYGHYGPFFIRMSWHAAGTYRTIDGRGGADGGMQRFAPLNSWPDNANLDKARRLLWPIKEKYGNKISWSDLIVLAGTLAMEDMGFEIIGFAGGREDAWLPEEVNWGSEGEWLGSDRHAEGRQLKKPFGATRQGLIYVNPEGPNGNGYPLAAAHDIRQTFGRMAMNDEEIVALIAGGHSFGKAHGAAAASKYVGANPEASSVEQQGLGWKNSYRSGKGADTITSGLEGAWTSSPAQWSHQFFENLFAYDWVQSESPGGAIQWIPKNDGTSELVPDAHDPDKFHAPIMLTTDLALKDDPGFRKISKRFYENPEEFEKAFARAWFKLTHRDMGPKSRYLGSLAPSESFIWQDPVPAVDHPLVNADDVAALKADIAKSGLSVPALVRTAWASASTYRGTDLRGGANGARVRLMPQKDWEANDPRELAKTISALEKIQRDFNDQQSGGKRISLADMIVLGGAVGIEQAAGKAGMSVIVPFTPGRSDALQEMTDIDAFDVLKPTADGFRNYYHEDSHSSPAEMLVEKAEFLTLSVPEMTVLVGGLRSLGANTGGSKHGVFTKKPGTLSNDFFTGLIDLSTEWRPAATNGRLYEGVDRKSGKVIWTATPVDLVFGSNSELRAVAEYYAYSDPETVFIADFVAAWTKVMNLGRF